ncbi:EamA family transporter [Desulfovibrio sp.]|uniref:EamA family transporter n=1 Tax=Desulfovibrio sp. TaxID=885 RepID=UPI0023D3EB4B|nr:EamA family transporter [Desulfovibrio sp.]MDE7241357.1 hypothetical protein [Desulfovibrio sp.]
MRLFLLIFFVVGFNSAAQLLLKAAGMRTGMEAWCLLALAFVCLGISFLCWFVALRHKPLAFLHPFAALVYVVVPGLAALIFGEAISGPYIAGILCIMAGICITSSAVRPREREEGGASC